MSTQNTKSDIPEIPDDLVGRPKVALTQLAAEDISAFGYRGEDGAVPLTQPHPEFEAELTSQEINLLCKTPPGFMPTAGLSREQYDIICSKNYPGQPVMDGLMGDLDPTFIIWLFENHPRDAHVRYYSRMLPTPGEFITKWNPDFRYKPIRKSKPMDFTQPASEGRKIDTVESLRAELAALKAAAKPIEVEDPEIAKLRAEIARFTAIKNHPPVEPSLPMRRPRPPQA